ncbi:MAG: hypothetical protein IPO17_04390 [Flavobacteriales bacterium]|nr:hypothetical protein [Flavobacteriales bacterium]
MAIAEFSNARDRLWVSYASSSGEANLHAVRVSQDREIFIGGYSTAAFPCHPSTGLYSTNALLGGQDGVIMHFDVAHQYLWGTYFGGEGAGNGERIQTIAIKENERLYTCGYTNTQYLPALLFPLTDEGIIGSWFEDFLQGGLDGFIAAFCFDDAVGISAPVVADQSQLVVRVDASGHWYITGASAGMQPILVCDAAGRKALHALVRVGIDGTLRVDPGVLASGIYGLRIGDRSTKVFRSSALTTMAPLRSIRSMLLFPCASFVLSCLAQPWPRRQRDCPAMPHPWRRYMRTMPMTQSIIAGERSWTPVPIGQPRTLFCGTPPGGGTRWATYIRLS